MFDVLRRVSSFRTRSTLKVLISVADKVELANAGKVLHPKSNPCRPTSEIEVQLVGNGIALLCRAQNKDVSEVIVDMG